MDPSSIACTLWFAVEFGGPTPHAEPEPAPESVPGSPSVPEERQRHVGPSSPAASNRTVVHDESGLVWGAQRKLNARTPAFATSIDLDDMGVAGRDLGRLLGASGGAHVRSIAGLGQFSSVSLRGSSPQQVRVYVDGVPIDNAMAGLVDLAQQPLDPVRRVDVYRGYVPVAFGRAALGGAINLVGRVHRGPPSIAASGGYGSFGARQASATVALPAGRDTGVFASLGYARAEGDFRYFDNGGTPTSTSDDTTTVRRNNGYDQVHGLVRIDARRGAWRGSNHESMLWKRQGIPGTANRQSAATRQQMLRLRSISSLKLSSVGGPGGHMKWVGGLGMQLRHYMDPLGEVGVGTDDERSWGLDGYLSPRLRLPLWNGAFLGLSSDVRGEQVDIDEGNRGDHPLASGDAVRRRATVGAGVELEQFAWERRLLLVPALRVDSTVSRFRVPQGAGEVGDEARDRNAVASSPRLGVRVRAWEGVSLRASGGRYFRPPTLMELFGDRGYMVGSEGLRPERGSSADGGIVVDRALSRSHRVYLQAAAFGVWGKDSIQWVHTGLVVRPMNLPGTEVLGVESDTRVSLWHRRLEFQASHTWLETRNKSPEAEQHDKPLPGRPRHDLHASAVIGQTWSLRVPIEVRLRYAVEHVSGTFLDASGRYGLPPRSLHGLDLSVALGKIFVASAEVRNLADLRVSAITPTAGPPIPYPVPVSDYIGYPLPGRSVWMSVRVDWTKS